MMISREDRARKGKAAPGKMGRWLPIALIAVAVAAWGLLLAFGAYLEWGEERPQRDPRKFWIVIACVGAFLAFWGGALGMRAWRTRR